MLTCWQRYKILLQCEWEKLGTILKSRKEYFCKKREEKWILQFKIGNHNQENRKKNKTVKKKNRKTKEVGDYKKKWQN